MTELRVWSRWAGAVLALSFLIPVDTRHDGAHFVWQLVPDVRAATAWTLLAPALGGAGIVAAVTACRRAPALAIGVLAAIAGVLGVTWAGAESLAWDLLSPPAIWSHGPAPGLLAVACAVAGVGLYAESATRRAAVVLLAVAAIAAAVHLLLPARGEAPLRLAARVLAHVAASSGPGNLLAASALALVVTWPGVAAIVGFIHARRAAPRPRSAPARLAAYGLPSTLLPLARRALADPWGGWGSVATAAGGVVVLAAVLVALTGAITFLAAWAARGRRPRRPEIGTALVAVALVALATLATARASTPADASVAFHLGPATPEGDRLFEILLPRWNDARAAADLPRAGGAGEDDAATAATSLIAAGHTLGDGLGSALGALAVESARPDLGERRWYALVERVNEASRQLGLPYYVDPREMVGTDGDTPRRWYRVDAYRVEEVRRFAAGGRELATLHVRAVTPARTGREAMGLERDVQPFAVVLLDEVRAYHEELDALAAQAPPRCATGPAGPPAVEEALRACGEALARLARDGDLGAALLAVTDWHELQHAIDGPRLGRSAWLERRLAFRPPEVRARIERELSAYLAQMTAPDPAPRLGLVRLLRLSLVARRGVEHDMALLAFEALEQRGDGDAARAYGRLAAGGDAGLRAGAERAWREVYGGALAGVVAR